jgi:hypothetical protein
MRGAIPPLPQYVFMAWCLLKHRDNFTFAFTCYSAPLFNSEGESRKKKKKKTI